MYDLKLSPTEEAALAQLATNSHVTPQGYVRMVLRAKLYESMESAALKKMRAMVEAGDEDGDYATHVRRIKAAKMERSIGYLAADDSDRLPLPEPIEPTPSE